MTSDRPLSSIIMPSVAMNGGIFSLAISAPETEAAQRARGDGATMPSGSGSPKLVSTTPAITAQKVISVPTERSMPGAHDHERGGDRQHAVDGGRLQDAHEVVDLQEVRRRDAEEHEQRDQAGEGEQLLARGGPPEQVGCQDGERRRGRAGVGGKRTSGFSWVQ
jgi:hypothetical protein